MKYVIYTRVKNNNYYLHSNHWVFSIKDAQIFENRNIAQAKLESLRNSNLIIFYPNTERIKADVHVMEIK